MTEEKLTLKRNLILLFSLYVTQYLGPSFFLEALAGILRKHGMPLERLSLIYLFGIFWLLKFLWAPLIDKVKLFKTHFKGWLVISQSLLVAIPLAIAMFSIVDDFTVIAVLFTLLSFISATQDVAVDGLAYRILKGSERGLGSGIKIAGGMIGYMIGGGVTLIIYGYIGWSWCFVMLAAITFIALVQVIFYKEPHFEIQSREKIKYSGQFISFWKGKSDWLLLLMVYPMGISIVYILSTPILVDLGWSLERIGFAVHVVGAVLGAFSSAMVGWLIKKIGKAKILISTTFIQALLIPLLLFPVNGYDNSFVVFMCVCAVLMVYSPSAAVLSVYMMDMSSEEMPATDYAMQHSLNLAVGLIASMLGTAMAGFFGYSSVVIAGSVLSLAATVLALLFSRRRDTVPSLVVKPVCSDCGAEMNLQIYGDNK